MLDLTKSAKRAFKNIILGIFLALGLSGFVLAQIAGTGT